MSYEQVVSILGGFSELKRKKCSQNRVNYSYPGSPIRRKGVLQELYLTGNGYLFVGYLPEYHNQMDKNQLINIKSLTQEEFKIALKKVIKSFHTTSRA